MTIAVQETTGTVVETTRFGLIEVKDEELLSIPEGIIGFDQETEYCLLKHSPESPFYWLQAIHKPALAFVAVNPFDFFSEYDINLNDADADFLGIKSAADAAVITLVTISGDMVTTNLAGPIVMNGHTKTARQLVISDSRYRTRHSLLSSMLSYEEE